MAEPTPFLPPFFLRPEISLFWGTSTAITPAGTQNVLLTLVGRKYSTGSSLLTSSLLMTLTHLSFYIDLLAVAPPLISFAASSLAFSCSWEELQNLDSDHLLILLSVLSLVFTPSSVPLPSIFRKLFEMTFPSTLILTVLLQRNTCLFLFSLLLLSLPL